MATPKKDSKNIVETQIQYRLLEELIAKNDDLEKEIEVRKQSEQSLRKSEELYKDLSQISEENPNPIIRLSLKGIIRYANKASSYLLSSWGCEIGKPYPKQFSEVLKQVITTEKPLEIKVEAGKRNYTLQFTPFNEHGYVTIYGKDITETKIAEEALLKSQYQYKQLVEKANDIIYKIDSNGIFTYVNPTAERITEMRAKEIMGLHFIKLIREDWQNNAYEFYQKQLEEKIPMTYFEFPILTKNGKTIWIGQNITTLEEEGEILGFLAIGRDITEKKQSEDNLLITSQRLSTLISNLHSGVLLENEKREIVLVNERFCNLFNIPATPEQLVGADCSSSAEQSKYLFADPSKFVERISFLLEMKQTCIGEEIELKDGRFLERDYIPIFIGDIYRGHLWKYTDITEKKRVEFEQQKIVELLQRSESKTKAILSSLPDLLFQLNHDKVFTEYQAPNMEELTIPPEMFLNKNLMETLPPKLAEQLSYHMDLAKAKNEVEVIEYELPDAKGVLQYYEGRITWNDQIGYVITVRNTTFTKQAELKLIEAKEIAEQSAHAKETFLANMSHEIRTPMNGILGMTDLLKSAPLSEKHRNYLESINTSAQNLLVIINDILDLSKIEAGKLELEKIGFRLNDLVKNTVAGLEHLVTDKDVFISNHMDSSFISEVLLGDPVRLNQILTNLLSNAIKFTERGEVGLTCNVIQQNSEEIKIKFSVSDTGIGIPENKLGSIFENFKQVDSSTTRKYGGTGLGLSICKLLVELQEGNIWVESEEGEGSVFHFELSFPRGSNKDLPSQKGSKELSYSIKGVNVLLVEDHNINQVYAISLLEDQGAIVELAENGMEAIEKLKEKSFDIVLMDIQMPVMGGVEATKIIRDQLKSEVPIISLTANALKGDNDKYLNAGMNEYVSKPFKTEELVSKMAQLLQKPQVRQNGSTEKTILLEESAKLYNLDHLLKMANGNTNFIHKMVNMFLHEVPKSIKQLQQYLEEEEYNRVFAIAHKMKPSFEMFGVESLKTPILQIETFAKEKNNLEQIYPLITTVKEVSKKVMDQLEAEFLNKME